MSDVVEKGVGVTTVASGAGLLVAPALALRLMGARTDAPAPYLFRIVGMFMALSGGILLDGVRSPSDARFARRWSAAQKLCAATAMSAGVATGHYRGRALLVALFDGVSGVLLLRTLRRSR